MAGIEVNAQPCQLPICGHRAVYMGGVRSSPNANLPVRRIRHVELHRRVEIAVAIELDPISLSTRGNVIASRGEKYASVSRFIAFANTGNRDNESRFFP